jgi:hypothetical protein
MKKLTVIIGQNGRLIATRLGHGPYVDNKSGIRSELVPKSGQTKHEIDVPEVFRSREELEQFHARVEAHISGLKENR